MTLEMLNEYHRTRLALTPCPTPGVDGNCWIWNKPNCDGYGPYLRIYTQLSGTPPARTVLDHLCTVKACCNPQHLEAVDNGTNLRRAAARRRNTERRIDTTKLPERPTVTTKHIAATFNCGQAWIRQLVRSGKLNPLNPNRKAHSVAYQFSRDEVMALANQLKAGDNNVEALAQQLGKKNP